MVRTLLAWGVLAVGILQVYEPVMHGLHFPEWSLTLVIVVLTAGFPITAVLAWVFDIGPGGVERTPAAPGRETVIGRPTLIPAGRMTLDRSPGPDRPAAGRVVCRGVRGGVQPAAAEFQRTFVVGRSPDCDVVVNEGFVSRQHLKVALDGRGWRLKDMGSGSGTFVDGSRIGEVALADRVEVELGPGGPRLALELAPDASGRGGTGAGGDRRFDSESQIIRRYLDAEPDATAGRETLLFRKAFRAVQDRTSRRYRVAFAIALAVALVLAGALGYQIVRAVRPAAPPGPSETR